MFYREDEALLWILLMAFLLGHGHVGSWDAPAVRFVRSVSFDVC